MKDGGFPGGASGKEPAGQCRRHRRCRLGPWVGKIPWRRAWQPTPVFLPGESHGQRSLVSYNPWGHKESDTTVVIKHACVHRQYSISGKGDCIRILLQKSRGWEKRKRYARDAMEEK